MMSLSEILRNKLEEYSYKQEFDPASDYKVDMLHLSEHAAMLLKKAAFGSYNKLKELDNFTKKTNISFRIPLWDTIGNPELYPQDKETSPIAVAIDDLHQKGFKLMFNLAHYKARTRGEYIDGGDKSIFVYYDSNFVDEINSLKQHGLFNPQSLYDLFLKKFKSTTMHELKHMYDDWRSEGEFANSKRYHNFLKSDADLKQQRKGLAPTDVKSKEHKIYKQYVNLKHEISAKFTQTMHKIDINAYSQDETIRNPRYKGYDGSEASMSRLEFDFAGEYDSWDLLNLADQKMVLSWLNHYWQQHHQA